MCVHPDGMHCVIWLEFIENERTAETIAEEMRLPRCVNFCTFSDSQVCYFSYDVIFLLLKNAGSYGFPSTDHEIA